MPVYVLKNSEGEYFRCEPGHACSRTTTLALAHRFSTKEDAELYAAMLWVFFRWKPVSLTSIKKPQAVLRTELQTYERNRQKLCEESLGKWAVIKQRNILGVFDTFSQALEYGYKTLGPVPMFVRQIAETDQVAHIL